MKVLPAILITIWIITLTLAAGRYGVGAELEFDFSRMLPGAVPDGFVQALCGDGRLPEWTVVETVSPQAQAGTNPPVQATVRGLTQLVPDRTDERFPLLIYEPAVMSDFVLTTRFMILGGETAQMAGIAFRVQNPSNFYVIRASATGNNFKFYKVVNGMRGELIGPTVSISTGRWYELKIECTGNQIRAWLDGTQLLPTLSDNTFRRGKLAFWTKSDSLVLFGPTRVEYAPVEWPARQLVRDALNRFNRLLGLHLYAVPPGSTSIQVVASSDPDRVGRPARAEAGETLRTGQVFMSKDRSSVAVLLPVRDRNGDPVAALEVQMTSRPFQSTQGVLARAQPVVQFIQSHIKDRSDLFQ